MFFSFFFLKSAPNLQALLLFAYYMSPSCLQSALLKRAHPPWRVEGCLLQFRGRLQSLLRVLPVIILSRTFELSLVIVSLFPTDACYVL